MFEKCLRCNKQFFKFEEDLRICLLKTNNLRKIEDRIKLVWGFIQDTEISLEKGYKADLLCYKGKELIIIELKNYKANYDAFGQILHYILLIENYHLKKMLRSFKFTSIRGFVLAHRISDELRNLVMKYQNCIPKIDLKEYYIDSDNQIIIDDSVCEQSTTGSLDNL